MDNRGTCSLKQKTTMDSNTVWQWRLIRAQTYSRRPEPFHYSNKIGLDFNVASNTQEKLDLQLVTNGVILEVCDFAKTVNKSKRHFITNILENNFALGLENEQQRIDFTDRILHKVKDLIRKPPKDKKELFTLFDKSSKREFNSNNGLNMASTERTSESFLVDMDNTDDSEDDDEFNSSQATSKEHMKTESLSEEMDGAHGDDSENEDELKWSGVTQSTEELKEGVLPLSFPYCEEIGLSLDFGSKQSLDPGLLTKGVMIELVNFTRLLTASFSSIVLGVLEHNFELDIKSRCVKNRIWFKISHLLKRRKRLTNTGRKITPEFKNEQFSFQTNPFKRSRGSPLSNMRASQYQFREVTRRRQSDLKNKQEKRSLLTTSDRVTKRRKRGQSTDMETKTLSNHTDVCTSGTAEGDHCNACPQEGSDLDSDKLTNSENAGNQDHLQNSTWSDIPRESESISLGINETFLNSTNVSSSLPTVILNVTPSFDDKKGLCGCKKQTQAPRSESNKCDMEEEKMEADNIDTCPFRESDLDSDKVTDSGNGGNQDHLKNSKSFSLTSDVTGESESSLEICGPFFSAIDVSSSLPTVILNVTSPFVSQPEKGLCGGKEQTQTPRNAPNQCDMEQEEMVTKNIWKLRANRVKQILLGQNKEFDHFHMSKNVRLEFDVGFGTKQNISVVSLTDSVLLELAKFALAINSSQQDFIMEILESNFDLGLQSQQHRDIFTCEIMKRVRQLRSCEDAVKFLNEVFELPGPMVLINMANRSIGSVKPELRNILKMEECDVASVCPPHLHPETKEPISRKSVDLHPFCKEIGLKLNVNRSQPNKKLDISKLTYGAMTEVTIFAKKLCGTFEEICLDILRHNFDLDLQDEDSELARNILARIPALMEQRNLSTCLKAYKNVKGRKNDFSPVMKLECQKNPTSYACGAGSSQAPIIDQNVGSSPDSEHQNELNLKMWKLRQNHIQHILSIPHGERCPLYSYSRCKKAGIDFNVGTGVKQNLDPNKLTNGIMVEMYTFATALQSATKHFITEILEYNFKLNFKNELDRSSFAEQIMTKIREINGNKKYSGPQLKMLFELPDTRYTQEPSYDRTTFCPKCFQDRNHKLCQAESNPGHMKHPCPHAMTDKVSADTNCAAQNAGKDLSSICSTTEETIMDCYPRCKKVGLNLCVDTDQPKEKLDTHVLTCEIMNEVASFAKRLCGTKRKIIKAVLEHNFNIDVQSQDVDPTELVRRAKARKDRELVWFSEVYVLHPASQRQPRYVGKVTREAFAMQGSELKETIKKRKLALQTKEERASLPSHNVSDLKLKTNNRRRGNCYPICTEMGLDLDVTSKSGEKEKLDLQLLTRAVVMEIYKFASQKVRHYFPHTLYDILDYNFDLSSQHYRRWEFSIATAFKVKTMVNQYHKNLYGADEIFELPFVFDPKASKRFSEKRQNKKSANSSLDTANELESSCLGICTPLLTPSDVSSSLSTVNSNENPLFASQLDKRGLYGGAERTQAPSYAPNECDVEPENNYTCPLGESDLDSDEFSDSGNAGNQNHSQNATGCDIPSESESCCLGICAPLFITTDVSSTLPTVNSNVYPSIASQPDKTGLCGGKEQTQTPRNSPSECDMKEEEMETEENVWKLRSNRVKQILYGLKKEFGQFNWSKKIGLEFNVGFGPKQNISVDSLTNAVLLELAKFTLAINSSQQDFIMEILEYNFDFGLQSQQHRQILTCETMKRVRQLTSCEDAVKFSNEIFELPGPMSSINVANQSMSSISPELRSISTMEECDVAPVCPPHLHAKTKEHISRKSVDLHPFCKEIGLKLNVNSNRPNKKLDMSNLTNGAMTEVTNFAEKLCGTFEQICLDILRHNFDLDCHGGDSEFARNILSRIPALMEQKSLSTCVKAYQKIKGSTQTLTVSTEAKLDCLKNPDLDSCAAGSSQAAVIDHNIGSSPDTEHQNEHNLKMWKLRANHIQRILSIPHGEHCPFYSYSRCKKAGIDFNVGCGVKQNLDPKLLTNGIMVELNTFATALQSATKHFVTEILEYNFNLNLKNEQDRGAFAEKTMNKIRSGRAHKMRSGPRMKKPFLLPDIGCVQEPTSYCPKCYQDRNHERRPHTMSDAVSADATSTAQKPSKDPSSTFSTTEETIMDSYPHCKKIGLNLCVDKYQPKEKLDTNVLTCGIVNEVANFAKKLCGTKNTILNDVLEHNFTNIMQSRVTVSQLFHRAMPQNDAWFSEVFVIQPVSHRQPVGNLKREAAMQGNEMKETIKKRKLALQTKEERKKLPSHNISDQKSKTNHRSRGNCYPICTDIGLDLDVTSKSAEKEKLDLKLLTRAVVMEIHTFATKKVGHSYPRTVFDILDYNFDLSSQRYRHWDFSIATASKVSNMVKQYKNIDRADEVFKLPFVFDSMASHRLVEETQNKKSANSSLDIASESESSCLGTRVPLPSSTNFSSSFPSVNSNGNPLFASQPEKRGLCGGEEHTQTPSNAPNQCDMEQEEMGTENNYTCPLGESNVDSDEVTDSGNAGNQNHLQNPKSCSLSSDIHRKSQSTCLVVLVPLLTTTDVSSISPTVDPNMNPLLARQPDKRGIWGGEEQTQTPSNAPKQNPDLDACAAGASQAAVIDKNIGSSPDTEHQNELNLRLWKLRANHIQRILSIPHKEHCPFYLYSRCKKAGIDFNVGCGVKQNLDPKLLTNGILVELNTFATTLQSATKHFVTEILEYNFNLNFKNELDRCAFAEQTLTKIRSARAYKRILVGHRKEVLFELPDIGCTQEPTTYCPKCYEDRNHELRQDESDPGHMNPPPCTMTDRVSADKTCTAHKPGKDPSSTFSTTEETIMDSYPCCKKIGLNLCVDKDRPNGKLDTHVLTRGIMSEVTTFAKRLCGTKNKILNDVLEHNFNIVMQRRELTISQRLQRSMPLNDALNDAWFSKVFVFRPVSHRQPGYIGQVKRKVAMQRSEMKEATKKRKLALQTKEERTSDVKSNTNHRSKVYSYPTCTEIGLDLDVTSKSAEKEKLDLKLLTRAVVMEIHKFASKKLRHSYPRTVYDILDYNFDLSSQHHRHWEFSIATASKVSSMYQRYHKNLDRPDEVFKLPFVFKSKASQRLVENKQNKESGNSSLDTTNELESSCLGIHVPFLTSTNFSSGSITANSNVNPLVGSQPDESGLCGGEEPKETPRNAPNQYNMDQEQMGTENNYTCPLGESDLDSDEVTDSEHAGSLDHLQNPIRSSLSSYISRESVSSYVGIHVPFLTTTDVSATLPSVLPNMNPLASHRLLEETQNKKSANSSLDIASESESCCLGTCVPLPSSTNSSSSFPSVNSNGNPLFASQPEKRGIWGGEEHTQTPEGALNQCDMEQEEMGTENNMWKLRANRVKQILSGQNKELGAFHRSKKIGLEFNVGFGRKQNISVDSLTNAFLLELAKFALAINSSQQDFIMEILEYNFDFGLQSHQHRQILTCETMKRVRQLTSCEDAVKFSNEIFELPGPMSSINVANQSMSSISPELRSISTMEECDVAPVCPPHLHAETKEHISRKSVDLHPFCKEIGLKLNVNSNRPNKKLDMSNLTNGAMTEVTNFAERLCGTFEQICLDILSHNFDLDCHGGDSELARSILARIPALLEQRNLSTCLKPYKKIKGKRRKISIKTKLDWQNKPNSDTCAAGSSQAAVMDQNIGSFPDSEHQNELNLRLWKLRANHIQRILSIPHGEHCPFYSYSRCKKAGIDFNVGCGVKKNLDPKLLTNGIMVELNTFATTLQSATKHFVTEILEYNFNLSFQNELDRSAFAEQTLNKIRSNARKRFSVPRMKMPFELPDMRCIQKPTIYCPKCFQDRNHKLHQDASDSGPMKSPRPCTMTDSVSADSTCTAHKPGKDPSSTFSTTEDIIMDCYPRCKKIGLNLCVDKDRPEDKLDTHVLTHGIMIEVASFATKLCGTKRKIINDVLEHNFNIDMQSQDVDPADLFRRVTARKDAGLEWFSEVFVIQPISRRQPGYVGKLRREAAMQISERKEAIKKRKLALQTKEERATLSSHSKSNAKSKRNNRSKINCYPICTEIGLDLDLTSKSGEKEKLDLQLLTRAVVMEIYKFASQKVQHYFPHTLYDILDYNFDLSSQHCRRLEFSIATFSKIQAMVKQFRKTRDRGDEVFKLPFVGVPKASQRFIAKRQNKKRKQEEKEKNTNEGSFVRQVRCQSDVSHVHFLDGVKSNEELWNRYEDAQPLTDPGTKVQMNGSLESLGCGSPLEGNNEIKEEEYDPHYGDVKPEPDTEEKYYPHCDDVKSEPNTEAVEHLVPGGPAGSLPYTLITICQNSESNINTGSENEVVKYYILAEPQVSEGHAVLAVCPNTESNGKTGSAIERVKHVVPVEAAASQGYSMLTVGQGNENALIKEEHENMSADSYHCGVVSYAESEEGIKQE